MEGLYGQADIGTGGAENDSFAEGEKENAENAQNAEEAHQQRIQKLLSYYGEVRKYIKAFELENKYAEDAVQDTTIEAITCIDKLKDEERMKFWVLKIAKRVAMRYLKKGCREQAMEASYEEYVLNNREKLIEPSDRELWEIIGETAADDLRDVIKENLTVREKKVIILQYVQGLNLKEISQIIGESYGNTRQISARAKIKIKTAMSKGNADEE